MSATAGTPEPSPPTRANGLPANHAPRKSKMSCVDTAPDLLKSAWQHGDAALPASLHVATPCTRNSAPIPGASGVQFSCVMLAAQVAPRQHTPIAGHAPPAVHAVAGPRHTPLNTAQIVAGIAAHEVAVQHAPEGCGHATLTHVVPLP